MSNIKYTVLFLALLSTSALAQAPVQLHVVTADSTSALLENVNDLSIGVQNALYFKFGDYYGGGIKAIGTNTAMARLGFFTSASPDANGLLERLSILDNGRVGVGLSNPQGSFHARGEELVVGRFDRDTGGGPVGLEIVSSPTENAMGIRSVFSSGAALILGLPGITVMPSGNVGIFAPPPFPIADFQTKFYVEGAEMPGGTAAFKGTTNTSHFNYGVSEDSYLRGGKIDSRVFINDTSGGGVFVSPNGGLNGFGTVSPLSRLHVQGNTATWLYVMGAGPNWWGQAENAIPGGPAVLQFGYNGNGISYIRSDNGAYVAVSDQRLKTNIASLGGTLGRVMQLRPVSYQMKTAPEAQATIGFIAQEVEPLFPEAVSLVGASSLEGGEPKSGQLLGINYDAFGVLAIKAIQEQQAIISDLQKRLEMLEKLVAEMKK